MFYVLAIGGTGNKVLESMVYGAAADAFYYPNAQGEKVPLDAIHMLSIDVDAGCGNTTRAKLACSHYDKVYTCMKPLPRHRGFHTALEMKQWNMSSEVRELSIDSQVKNHKSDQPLARALFNKTESGLEYNEGFRGHPDLGVLFFSDMLEKINDPARKSAQDDFADTVAQIERNLNLGDTVRVALVGSIFGGTGASGIPIISKYLRDRFGGANERFLMSVTLMLPYYKVPASAANEDMEIVIDSTVFMDKAKTALDYYGAEQMVATPDKPYVYDSLYLLGLPREGFVSTRTYATGSSAQENDAHMMEWLAVRSIAHFFRETYTSTMKRGSYIYQMHTPTFSWESFDAEEKHYRLQFGGLLKAGAVLMAECYPHIVKQLEDDRLIRNYDVNYYAAFFGAARRMNAEQREALIAELDAAASFFRFYGRWMIQMLRSLPPTMRNALESEERITAATEHYQLLLRQNAQVRLLEKRLAQQPSPETERQLETLRPSAQTLAEEQQQLDAPLSQQDRNSILYYARQNAKAALHRIRVGLEESRHTLEELRAEFPERATQAQIDLQDQTVAANQRQLERQECVLEAVEADWQQATFNLPAGARAAEQMEIPRNDLINAELALMLETLLEDTARERSLTHEAVAEQLLGRIETLSIQKLRDTMSIQRIMAALGQGTPLLRSSGDGPTQTEAPAGAGTPRRRGNASPCAEFLAALLTSMFDEVVL